MSVLGSTRSNDCRAMRPDVNGPASAWASSHATVSTRAACSAAASSAPHERGSSSRARASERAPGARLLAPRAKPFLAEHQITAGEQLEVVAHPAAVMFDKAD